MWYPGIDLLNLSIQNTLDCISENFNLKNFPGGAFARNSPEKCAIRSPDGHYRTHIATVYCISRPPSITKSSVHHWKRSTKKPLSVLQKLLECVYIFV